MKNLSPICYHYSNKLNLGYLTQIKKQDSTNRLWLLWLIWLITARNLLFDKLTSNSDLNNLLMLDDKVCKHSTSSYHINILNSLNNNYCNYCIVFLWFMVKLIIIIIIIIMIIIIKIWGNLLQFCLFKVTVKW